MLIALKCGECIKIKSPKTRLFKLVVIVPALVCLNCAMVSAQADSTKTSLLYRHTYHNTARLYALSIVAGGRNAIWTKWEPQGIC